MNVTGLQSRLLFLGALLTALAVLFGQWYLAIGFQPHDPRWWVWLFTGLRRTGALPEVMQIPLVISAVVLLLGLAVSAACVTRARNRLRGGAFDGNTLHGSARWAQWSDLRRAGLRSTSGVVTGAWSGLFRTRVLRHDGPEHIMVYAPTRSGKGVSLIVPTLLEWPDSVLVLDIKGENHALSAGYRASLGHRILKFEPSTPGGSVRYNPLAEIRFGTGREIQDCQNVATMIVDPEGKGLKDYWMQEGWAWLSTALLHVLMRIRITEHRTASLADVNSFLSGVGVNAPGPETTQASVDDSFIALLRDMMAFDHGHPVINAEVTRGANRLMIKAGSERSGVHSSAITGLALWADPIVAANTAESDFRIADLMNGPVPVALYLITPPSDIDRLRPLFRILINQFIRRLTEKMEFADGASVRHYRHRLLLLLDEFTAVGQLDIVEKALAFMAGYGLKAFIVVQDIGQLHQTYGRDETITSNCHVRIAFAPNRIETARALSDMAGKTTVVQDRRSLSGQYGALARSVSDSVSETARPLLTADEAMRLPGIRKNWRGRIRPGQALVFVAGHPPVRAVQALYFQDPRLLARARIPAPAPGDQPEGEKR